MSLVDTFTHLKGRARANDALPLLRRIASLVKPVMRKHSWKLPVLAEFFPNNPSLVGLDVNGGQKILLRLRPPEAPNTFYDEEQLVAVMLHELTHNVHGPHDDKFYKFLSELEAEYDTMKRSGYDGEGFYSKGIRLGVGVSHNLPSHLARTKALQAAERRKVVQGVLADGGGQRLGGRSLRGLSPRELAVQVLFYYSHTPGVLSLMISVSPLQAAEMRARDEKSCGTRLGSEAQKEADEAARDSIEDKAAVLDVPVGDRDSFPPENSAAGASTSKTPTNDLGKEGWPCPVCTLNNPSGTLRCLACLSTCPFGAPTTSTIKANLSSASTSQSRLKPAKELHRKKSSGPASPLTSDQAKCVDPCEADSCWSCPTCTLRNQDHHLQCSVCCTIRPQKQSKDGWTCMACGQIGMPHEFWSCRLCGHIKESSARG
ncbi:WLM domain-containing protein [Phellopilus nigrolimitatus]|nr:WLM domain-containing protein [Phellopilus nigrolimitatus]